MNNARVLVSSLHLDAIDRIARAQRGLHIADLASTSLAKMKALPSPLVANTGSSFQKRLFGARRNDGVGYILGRLCIMLEFHRVVGATLRHGAQRSCIAKHF